MAGKRDVRRACQIAFMSQLKESFAFFLPSSVREEVSTRPMEYQLARLATWLEGMNFSKSDLHWTTTVGTRSA